MEQTPQYATSPTSYVLHTQQTDQLCHK